MFKSIEYIKFDEKIHEFVYNLIDTDFECELTDFTYHDDGEEIFREIVSISKEYEKRHLNVESNLALYIKKYVIDNGYKLDDIVAISYDYDLILAKEFWNKYWKCIQKYMLLM